MDEWVQDGKPVPITHPLSFAKADMAMSLLSLHPNVQFNYYRPAPGTCEVAMH